MNRLENIFLMRHAHSAGNANLSLYRHIPDHAKPPNGESRYDVCVRIHQFFGTIIRDAEKPQNSVSNVFIISHGTTLRAFTMMWLHREVDWLENERNPANCSIRLIARSGDGRFEDSGYIFQGFKE